jgi:hypothetical protein
MGSCAGVNAAPRHDQHDGKADGGYECPRELDESSRRRTKNGARDCDVGDDANEDSGPEEQLCEKNGHGQLMRENGGKNYRKLTDVPVLVNYGMRPFARAARALAY